MKKPIKSKPKKAAATKKVTPKKKVPAKKVAPKKAIKKLPAKKVVKKKTPVKQNKLTPRQEKFCIEYLKDFNGTQAAIRSGYSKKTATEQAARLLTNVKVKELVDEARAKDAANAGLTRQMVLEGYKKLAFYDSRKFYDQDGSLKKITDLDDDEAFALSAFEEMEQKGGDGEGNQVTLSYLKKVKMSDRKGALDSIAKVLGFNEPDKVEHSGGLTFESFLMNTDGDD